MDDVLEILRAPSVGRFHSELEDAEADPSLLAIRAGHSVHIIVGANEGRGKLEPILVPLYALTGSAQG